MGVKNGNRKKNYDADKISLATGVRNLTISSSNVDTLRTNDAIGSILRNLEYDDIDIACMQETHNNRNDHTGATITQ